MRQSKTTKILLVMQNEPDWLSSQDISFLLSQRGMGDVSPKAVAQLLRPSIRSGAVESRAKSAIRAWVTSYDCGLQYHTTTNAGKGYRTRALYGSTDQAPVGKKHE
jgi:hypothetical protein